MFNAVRWTRVLGVCPSSRSRALMASPLGVQEQASGRPIDPRNLLRHFYAVRKRAGLETYRFHDIRHTAVSLLLDLGVPPHVVREIVGHSAIEVTMDVYAHAS
ncbi:tyrosine-type recombinase/integrase [Sphaerisporangium viridialbum]|uniref:tyrosine-type recombinase/integrase n=1 Tax=Sphaerisporangium viridialbum TaxID=46189 RepID=UPI003C74EB25